MKKFIDDLVKMLKYNPAPASYGQPKTIIAEELPSSILYHDGWLYVTGRGTVRRYKQSRAGRAVGRPRDHRPGLLRLPPPPGFRPDHRQRRLALHHQRRRRQLRRRVRRQPGDRAADRGGVPLQARTARRWNAYSLGYRNPYRDVAYDDKFNFFHADNDNEDGSKFMGCRLMHVAEGVGLRLAAADRGPLLPAGPRPRGGRRRTARASCRRCSRPAAARRPACSSTTTPACRSSTAGCCTTRTCSASSIRAYKVAPDGLDVQGHRRVRVPEERRPAVPPVPDGDRAGRGDLRLRLADRLRRGRQALRRRRPRPHLPHHLGRHEGRRPRCRAAAWIAGRRSSRGPTTSLSKTLDRRTSPTASRPARNWSAAGRRAASRC